MLKLYCQKCGALNAYISEKPNFCQKCGDNFGKVIASELPEEQLEDEESETIPKFDLQGLDVEIDATNRSTEVIGDIAGSVELTDAEKNSKNFKPPEGAAYTAEDFKREAGNTRGGNEAAET